MLRMKSPTLRTPAALVDAGLAPPERLAELERVAARYAVAITPALTDLMDPSDPEDPMARQFVPDIAELDVGEDERADPIGDETHAPVDGIVHRYPDRVLLKLVDICAAYCRFCFRREQVGKGSGLLQPDALAAALGYIRAHPQIWEVILSGGDPLVLSARRLAVVAAELAAIEHVKILRVHTRVPIAAPSRVTSALLRALKKSGKAVYVAVHVNHARELSKAARRACARFVDAGIPLLSQTVLLRGVNDDADVLGNLLRALVECRIKPYYLHHGDLAPGTAHWRTSIARGQSLMRALRGRYSGLCQPTYVLDIPGGHGKVPIGPQHLRGDEQTGYEIEDFRGQQHRYEAPSS
ncbi:MAG TPA: lysine-2,3-aminomutase-like protein [Xanthobacteraceae bacterium]|nr:lysine-2,3-aminomutase-like protein [Xanthobacteraceae bacterium]